MEQSGEVGEEEDEKKEESEEVEEETEGEKEESHVVPTLNSQRLAINLATTSCQLFIHGFDRGTCLVPALIDDPRCGRCIITKSQSPKFTGGLRAAWLGRMN
ncbi:hypothetical protein PoB_006958500 [Plakobranchus ocellatus]|uniref:Uncharacterized protein n=1 Tax=Plakobranchus ocellatus TaxID=259542 RepID=A0AAV4DGC6_9GAST|nr:hypothetical protein PoB_006958500 [Plakobranchus ocellatus]